MHVGTVVTSPHLRAFTALCRQFSLTFSRVGLCDRQYMIVVYNFQNYVIKDLVSAICTLSFVSLPLGEASCYDDSETAMEMLMNRERPPVSQELKPANNYVSELRSESPDSAKPLEDCSP